jgi:hypothetical protein
MSEVPSRIRSGNTDYTAMPGDNLADSTVHAVRRGSRDCRAHCGAPCMPVVVGHPTLTRPRRRRCWSIP